ncbi:MAG: hypothetical protein ACRER2_09570 [Methylococcales bacterium]
MAIKCTSGQALDRLETRKHSRYRTSRTLSLAVAVAFGLGAGPARAAGGDEVASGGRFCSATTFNLFKACGHGVVDSFLVAKAKCLNVSNQGKRQECFAEARSERNKDTQLCREERDGRLDACKLLGEDRYDPDFNPANFDDPKNPTNPNPYYPLAVGYTWEYRGGDEVNTVEVLNATKLIEKVTCIVVRDQVFKNGDLAEGTDDWFGTAKDGNTWYCGEEVKDYQSFDGDAPRAPELVMIDGTFKVGRNGAKPGIIFQALPTVGQVYREESAVDNAEDVSEILSTTYAFGSDPNGLDQFVPQPLADRLCSAGDCVVTRAFSLLGPGPLVRKYFARDIGFFLEVKPDTGEVLQLVDCNFDARCAGLPTP